MAEETFDPEAAGAVAVEEPKQFDPVQFGAVPVQEPKQEGGTVSGILAGLGRALNPINLVKGALDIGHPSDISNIIQYGKTLGEIVTGTSPDEAIGRNIPELQQQREAVYGKLGGREQAAALTGIGLQLGLTALPFIRGEVLPRGPLAEVAGIAKPEVAPEPTLTTEAETAPIAPEVALEPQTINGVGLPDPMSKWEDLSPEQQEMFRQKTQVKPEDAADAWGDSTFQWKLQQAIAPEETQPQPVSEAVAPVTAEPLPETPQLEVQPTPEGGEISAVQEPSAGEILQREPQEAGAPGGERAGVEQGVQGEEIAQTRSEEITPKVKGDLWYSGVGPEGETTWVTSNLEKAKIYAQRRGEGGRINVYTPDQVGETAFADQEGNLISPQEYAKTQSEDTTLQVAPQAEGKPLPTPIQRLDANGKPISEVAPTVPQPEQVPAAETPQLEVQPEAAPVPSAEAPTTAEPLPKTEPPAPAEAVTPQVSDQEHISTIANKFTQERTASGELGEIAPGQGYSAKEMAAQGLKMPPEQINQNVSDLMNGTGNPIEQGKAVRAEEARLSQRSQELSRAAASDPTNVEAKTAADNAFKDVTDFHNGPVAQLKTIFHATGVGLQGELPVDLSTFNGLREAWLKDNGTVPPPEVEPKLQKMAENVNKSVVEDNGAKQALSQEIDKATTNRKLPTYDEVRNNIMDRIKEEPCRT